MNIACIGWGSLIWSPRELPIDGEWAPDGPDLPVEYARHSSRERVTLVILPEGTPVPTLWIRLRTADLEEARAILATREATTIDGIGMWSRRSGRGTGVGADLVERWARDREFDAVLWTGLPPRWNGKIGAVPTLDEVLSFLRGQPAQSAAEEYIRRTPAQVQTPYRARIETELGWF